MHKFFLIFIFLSVCLYGEDISLTFSSSKKEQTTTVEANLANYDGDKIDLVGNIVIENAMGKAKAQLSTLLKGEDKKCKIDFPFIELSQEVEVFFSEGGSLYCEKVCIDLIALTSYFEGSLDKPVIYSDARGQILAKCASIDFIKQDKGSYIPQKVTLIGNVRLQDVSLEENRYALADYVEVFPQENLINFEARGNNKVLFFDEKRNVQLSANKIEAKKDRLTQKESIKGHGDVQFLFAKDEFEKIKQNFSLS